MKTIRPENGGLLILENRLCLRWGDGWFQVALDPSGMRRLALALGCAADRLEGREPPAEMVFLAEQLVEGHA